MEALRLVRESLRAHFFLSIQASSRMISRRNQVIDRST